MNKYAYEWVREFDETKPVIVALHGFTGTKATFRQLSEELPEYNWLLIDQLGHGQSSDEAAMNDFVFATVLSELALLLEQLTIPHYSLIGYSMGARVALGWAIMYPDRIRTLILESGSPGLRTTSEQIDRQRKDQELILRLENESLETFVDFWQKLPLFHSQKNLPATIRQKIRAERLSQHPKGLANSLRVMGTGSQPSYWESLAGISIPTLYIYGELDKKFGDIGRKMQKEWQSLSLSCIKEAGHCVHLEKPSQFSRIVGSWLEEELKNEN